MKNILIAFLLLFSLQGLAQKHNLTGLAADENGEPMPSATVMLLSPGDSIMKAFAISKPDGSFEVKGVQEGAYILQLSFVGYKIYFRDLELNEDLDLGKVQLEKASYNLDEILLEDYRVPMKIKDDTIAYDAKAFTTRPNAVVEDLLEQLPGIEVEDDGSIKAQGEDVQNVLVDGKEFFGDDPKMATKNLPADAIDKVEVYDKLSDMAEFTGIEDGEEEKTINLVLKEGAKAGYFGSVYAGGGYDPALYEGKVMINRFTKTDQTSILALSNNNNEGGFSISDYIQFMGGMKALMSGGGLMLDPSQLALTTGDGITRSTALGLNFNREFGKKTDFRSSYLYTGVNTDLQQDVHRIYAEQAAFDEMDQVSEQTTDGGGHKVNFRLKHKIDSAQRITLRGDASLNTGNIIEQTRQLTYANDELRNAFSSRNNSRAENWSANAELDYKKKLSANGRNMGFEADYSYGFNDQLGRTLQEDTIGSSLNQEQQYFQTDHQFYAELDYTEPLSRNFYVEPELNYTFTTNRLNKRFYDLQEEGEPLISDLSRVFETMQSDYVAGLNLKYNKKKLNVNLGLDAQVTYFQGTEQNQSPLRRDYALLLPNASFKWKPAASSNLRLRYRTNLQVPTLEQLQPVVDNTNPQQIYIGNPNLDAAYRHSASLNYMNFSQFNFRSFFVGVNYTYTDNPVKNAVFTDSLFRQVLRPTNVDYEQTATFYANHGGPIPALAMKYSLRLSESYTDGILFIDGDKTKLDRWNHSLTANVENRKKEKFDASLGARLTYSQSFYKDNASMNQEFLNATYTADFTYYLGDVWTLGTELRYQVFYDAGFDNSATYPFIDFNLSRYFLKDNKGELSFRVIDALNQNQGYAQDVRWNFIEERTSNNLGRFFMLRFTYNLKGFGSDAPKQKGKGNWHRF